MHTIIQAEHPAGHANEGQPIDGQYHVVCVTPAGLLSTSKEPRCYADAVEFANYMNGGLGIARYDIRAVTNSVTAAIARETGND